MENNRRDFIKRTGLTGLGLAAGFLSTYAKDEKELDRIRHTAEADPHVQRFNMSGYAAPKLEKVRVGFVGLGNRGSGAVDRLIKIEGVEIKALCDLRPEKVAEAQKLVEAAGHHPALYSGTKEIWKKLCERDDLDLVYILTPWALHTPIAVFSMNHGKHVCVEVPAAKSLEECWQLVETSERTKKHCMMTENCCYDFSEMLTLNMARQGFFGEIVHCE